MREFLDSKDLYRSGLSIFCVSLNFHVKGILAQDTSGYMKKTFGPTYIAASYIKYIESAGGRVIPIRYPSKIYREHRNSL